LFCILFVFLWISTLFTVAKCTLLSLSKVGWLTNIKGGADNMV